jgi:uncharacterized protein (DUF2237 family)
MKQNVLGTSLKICGLNPRTGFDRSGYCSFLENDIGTHIVCAIVTDRFLNFTKSQGNDLISSSGSFPGLKEGDRWCLCVLRWLEAYRSGVAPLIDLEATSDIVLKFVDLSILKKFDYMKENYMIGI